jgi:hypothetical protein
MKADRTGTVLMLATLLAACGGGESRWAGTITDSAGVTIVSNPAEGIWTGADRWTVEEELKIGVVEGDPDYQFGEIWGITVDSRGRIFVLDFHAQHIQVYSPDGVYQQTVGAPGAGPGELRGAVAVLMGPGDTLLVQDNRAIRFNRYSPDGSSAGGFRIALEGRRPKLFKTSASGVIAEHFVSRDAPGQPGIQSPKDGVILLTTDGTVIDTLLTFPSVAPRGIDGRLLRGAHVYAPEMIWDLTDDVQLFCGINNEYRIAVYSNRRLERIIAKPFDRRPVRDGEREAIRERFYSAFREAGASPEMVARMWSSTHIGDFVPAFQDLAVGPLGSLWARHVQPVSELIEEEDFDLNNINMGAPEWDVFDYEGRFLGVVAMPHRFEPMVFRGDKIYGLWRDELDVQYVVRLRVLLPDAS